MDSICNCPDSGLIVKQRQEIILLTDDLNNQENEIKQLLISNAKLKTKIKLIEKDKLDLENANKSLKKEIFTFKDDSTKKNEEFEAMKQKLTKKDQLIQNQSVKFQQISIDNEKLKQQLTEKQRLNKELKAENSKYKLTIKEQSNKISELKSKTDELLKFVENKNELIKISSNQIEILEANLNNLVNFVNIQKAATINSNANTNKEPSPLTITSILTSGNKEETETKRLEPENNTKNSSNEVLFHSVIQSLKDTWLESNLKYEELKTLIVNKFQQEGDEFPLSKLTINGVANDNNSTVHNKNPNNRTSTPAKF